ncbi:hypothetical protein ACFXPY_05110, partial [Streptomyces sp. NPDC059153]
VVVVAGVFYFVYLVVGPPRGGAELYPVVAPRAGFTVLWEHSSLFTPAYEAAVAEPQLFLHCRRA